MISVDNTEEVTWRPLAAYISLVHAVFALYFAVLHLTHNVVEVKVAVFTSNIILDKSSLPERNRKFVKFFNKGLSKENKACVTRNLQKPDNVKAVGSFAGFSKQCASSYLAISTSIEIVT
eukprot:Seg1926.3 transcript_id=Seg1926.3/GoldUCD/mRNA.D3Y31 product="hypothetical protein" protein_id=Seg1926.3/GoldUCD/D3Y31